MFIYGTLPEKFWIGGRLQEVVDFEVIEVQLVKRKINTPFASMFAKPFTRETLLIHCILNIRTI